MSIHENQVSEPNHHYDQLLEEIELMDPNGLYLVVPGSTLHQKFNNPVKDGIDES
ncbi:MAG: hypothetical protein QNJ56_04780 [Gammaproteobacteria bacterium]|nr:hypothetical protein [Gammaproteobacteria bacterium]